MLSLKKMSLHTDIKRSRYYPTASFFFQIFRCFLCFFVFFSIDFSNLSHCSIFTKYLQLHTCALIFLYQFDINTFSSNTNNVYINIVIVTSSVFFKVNIRPRPYKFIYKPDNYIGLIGLCKCMVMILLHFIILCITLSIKSIPILIRGSIFFSYFFRIFKPLPLIFLWYYINIFFL